MLQFQVVQNTRGDSTDETNVRLRTGDIRIVYMARYSPSTAVTKRIKSRYVLVFNSSGSYLVTASSRKPSWNEFVYRFYQLLSKYLNQFKDAKAVYDVTVHAAAEAAANLAENMKVNEYRRLLPVF